MLQDGFAGMREGDLFHGRYRILRHVEDDRTSTTYEATDTLTDSRLVLRLIRPDTIAGDRHRILFKGDAPGGEADNVAYLSNAGLDLATKSFFVCMELDDDEEDENAVTQVRDHSLHEASSIEPSQSHVRADSKRTNDNGSPADAGVLGLAELSRLTLMSVPDATIRRPSVPLPLPLPLPPRDASSADLAPQAMRRVVPLPPPPPTVDSTLAARASSPGLPTFGPLPPPTPPPERPLTLAAPLPEPPQISIVPTDTQRQKRSRMHAVQRLFAIAIIAIIAGGILYSQLDRTEAEPTTTAEDVATTSTPPASPPPPTVVADPATAAAAPTNSPPAETAPPKQEDIAPATKKSATDRSVHPTTKRRRETLY